jgi:predicted dienelactone hydrolase
VPAPPNPDGSAQRLDSGAQAPFPWQRMRYEPFARGPHPVGVRSADLVDAGRGRRLTVEVWYPAAPEYRRHDVDPTTCDRYELLAGFPVVTQDAVRDATPAGGEFPLVLFSHGYGGHRRQSTFLCTHLASHGYVVAATDHTGNTIRDVLEQMVATRTGRPIPDFVGALLEFARQRPADASWLIDRVLDGTAGDVADRVDAERIGIAGHSFGGWTTLTTTAREPRVRAALALAPAGGASPLPADHLERTIELDWDRDVPTLFVVAERDSLLPLDGMRDMYRRTRGPKRMVVLQNADHLHFCDRIEELHELFRLMPQDPIFEPVRQSIAPIAELCPAEHAYQSLRALGLAHMDAHLKGHEPAARLLSDDVGAMLAARGIDVRVA